MNRLTGIGSLLLLGCAMPPPAPQASAGISAPRDNHDLAVAAIEFGIEASVSGDPARLVQAEQRLAAAGARPDEGTQDLGSQWRGEAEAIAGDALPQHPVRGRVLGSAYKHAVLDSGQALALEQIFMAGRKAKVSVVPSGASRLSFSISEHDGSSLCSKSVDGEPESCAWLPTWTTRYKIELRNRGAGKASVYLIVD